MSNAKHRFGEDIKQRIIFLYVNKGMTIKEIRAAAEFSYMSRATFTRHLKYYFGAEGGLTKFKTFRDKNIQTNCFKKGLT